MCGALPALAPLRRVRRIFTVVPPQELGTPNPDPTPDLNPSGSRVVSGRRVLPTCAQALPSDPSFIGCPGIRCGSPGSASDYTVLFNPDGTRDSGNRQTTPLEVLHPKDPARFNARSWACPWASYLAQATLERCADAAALRRLLDECAPRKALKVKPVDGMCAACYAAHAPPAPEKGKDGGGADDDGDVYEKLVDTAAVGASSDALPPGARPRSPTTGPAGGSGLHKV